MTGLEDKKQSSLADKAKKYASTGILGSLLMFLIPYIDGKVEAIEIKVDKSMETRYETMEKYVDQKHEQVNDKLDLLIRSVEKIDKRLYDFKQTN